MSASWTPEDERSFAELLEASRAADELVEAFLGHEIAKAAKKPNPLNRSDFLHIVRTISDEMRGIYRDVEQPALEIALKDLRVDWASFSVAQQKTAVERAISKIRDAHAKALPRVEKMLSIEGDKIVAGAREGAKAKWKLDIRASTTQTDERIGSYCAWSTHSFVRDSVDQVDAAASQTARAIAASGIDRGLGSDEIAQQMSAALAASTGKPDSYFAMVSLVFVNRARTWQNIHSFNEAGIDAYLWQSVLDEATSVQCRFLHGTRFPVKSAVQSFETLSASNDPEDIKKLHPFVQSGLDDEGEYIYFGSGSNRTEIARVVDNAVGRKDDVGSFANGWDSKKLTAAGLTMPPIHGRCRSTVIPDFG